MECAMPTTNYGPTTTAAEIVRELDLHGRRVVVTGASSGIGAETARALAYAGADVTLAVRNLEAGTEAGGDFDQAVLAEEREQKGGGAGERGGDHRRYGPHVSLHGIPIVTFFYHVCRAEGYFIGALMSEVKFAFVAVWARAGCYLPPVVNPGIRKVGWTSFRLAQS